MRFISDRMLGKLGKRLRVFGFDSLYINTIDLPELLRIAGEQKRIILTQNPLMNKQSGDLKFLLIKDDDPERQLEQVIDELNLDINPGRAFTRCLVCNYVLQKIRREDVAGKIPDYVFETHRGFAFCGKCGRIFWRGSHHENMLVLLERYSIRKGEKPGGENSLGLTHASLL